MLFCKEDDCKESKIFKGSPNRRCDIHANGPFELPSNDKWDVLGALSCFGMFIFVYPCKYCVIFFLTGNQVCFF